MDLMDAIIALVIGIAGALGVFTLGGRALFSRMADLEAKDQARQKAVATENKTLKERVADLEEKQKRVPQMQQQLDTLLNQVSEMQKRIDTLQAALDNKEREIARLSNETAAQKETIHSQEAEIARLLVKVETYQSALSLLGREITPDEKAGSNEPPETNEQPEAGAEAEETPNGTTAQ